ncbi:MAG: hypothetical protein R3F60_32565 [bacterium]
MSARRRAALAVLVALAGCSEADSPAEGADAVVPDDRCLALLDDCPAGTTPTVEASVVAACEGQAGAELRAEGGEITGICQRRDQCQLVCSLADPCRCGIDRVTREGVFCAPCGEAGCGDGICEGGEDPASCPADCGARCDPGGGGVPAEQRCDGEVREVCEANARWAALACRDDQICEPYAGGADRLTFCQTRTQPLGGTLHGLGSRGFQPEGRPADIRFATPDLTCPDQRIGLLRVVFEATGGLLFIDGDPIVRMDLATRPARRSSMAWGALDFQGGRAVVGTARVLTVWEAATGRALQTRPFVDDYVAAPIGPVALAPDGLQAAAALVVEGQPTLAAWDATTGAVTHLLRFDADDGVTPGEGARALRFSANGLHRSRAAATS